MRKILYILLLISNIVISQTNYYVDSDGGNDANDGLTPATAWQNIERLDTTTVLNYGDSVLLQRGDTWTGRMNLSTTYWPNGVIIGAYGTGAKPLINGNGNGNSQPTIKAFGFESIKISYLDLNIGNVTGVYGIWADDSDSLWVDSCKIHDNSYATCLAFGIVVTDQPWVSITRNEIYNMGTEAFYGGVSGSENGPSIVAYNYCYNIGNCGANADVLHFNNVNPSVWVYNNYLDMRNPDVTTGKGCLVFTQDTGFVYNVRVFNNIMLADSAAGFGFSFGRAQSAPNSRGKVAYNNYVRSEYIGNSVLTGVWDSCYYNMFIGFSHVFDLRISDTAWSYHMYNNYIRPKVGPPTGYVVLIDDVVDSNSWYFKNNIVYFNDRFELFGKYYEKDYNIYLDVEGANDPEENSIYNNTSQFWDTLFINDTFDINPNSLAVDAGVDIGLKFDYKGNPVPYNLIPDIGVNEYTPSGPGPEPPTPSFTKQKFYINNNRFYIRNKKLIIGK